MNVSMKVLTGLLVLGLVAFLFIEWMQRAPVAALPRPPSVPGDAVWLGLNKGEWFQCNLASGTRNVVNCTIYNDVKGEKVSSGGYRWDGDRDQDLTVVPPLKSFDGQIIDADGGKLIPIGKHVFYLSESDSWTKDYLPGQ